MANPITTKAVEMTALSFFFSIESQSMNVHDAREHVRPAHAILAGNAGNAYCMQAASSPRIDGLRVGFHAVFVPTIYMGFQKKQSKATI
ncbi:MAG: hypothetical protein RR983_14035 [Massilia sp.]|uniref:hypothetical protein n=1 Tax=Massilia sp. TaxID=1882437 RepID=UPI00198B3627|nr:hypothetical protein [Oxalobacteraceae sp. CFBP 8755]